MSIADQTLYPPLVDTYMPAFLQYEICRVYFSITGFNLISNIVHAQLSLTFIENNQSALNTTLWPNKIKFCTVYTDTSIDTDYKYYIEINPAQDLKNSFNFVTGQYYKVQLRFSSIPEPEIFLLSSEKAIWLRDNIGSFSEWSRVCLIKGIPAPFFNLQGLKEANVIYAAIYDNFEMPAAVYDSLVFNSNGASTEFAIYDGSGITAAAYDSGILFQTEFLSYDASGTGIAYDFVNMSSIFVGNDNGYGAMAFVGQYGIEDKSEPLRSYRAILYDKNNNLLSDSGPQSPDTRYSSFAPFEEIYGALGSEDVYNSFSYRFNYNLTNGTPYILKITFTTRNGYQVTKTYDFVTAYQGASLIPNSLIAEPDPENGRIKLYIDVKAEPEGVLLIRRADHTSNFGIWDDLHESTAITGDGSGNIIRTFYDYTVESGILYNYYVSDNYLIHDFNERDASNNLILYPMINYEDMFLAGNNKQLKIQFDPKVSSFKYAVSDSKTETLGGKYPFVRRNGSTKYREFSVGGLISAQMDDNALFVSKLLDASGTPSDLYGNYSEYFKRYNNLNRITPYHDSIQEKKFRDAVLEFLYDGRVKLFKSTTEGNALVKVTDVSLAPTDALGRMIYSFSALLTEVDDFNLRNCIKYGLQVDSDVTEGIS